MQVIKLGLSYGFIYRKALLGYLSKVFIISTTPGIKSDKELDRENFSDDEQEFYNEVNTLLCTQDYYAGCCVRDILFDESDMEIICNTRGLLYENLSDEEKNDLDSKNFVTLYHGRLSKFNSWLFEKRLQVRNSTELSFTESKLKEIIVSHSEFIFSLLNVTNQDNYHICTNVAESQIFSLYQCRYLFDTDRIKTHPLLRMKSARDKSKGAQTVRDKSKEKSKPTSKSLNNAHPSLKKRIKKLEAKYGTGVVRNHLPVMFIRNF